MAFVDAPAAPPFAGAQAARWPGHGRRRMPPLDARRARGPDHSAAAGGPPRRRGECTALGPPAAHVGAFASVCASGDRAAADRPVAQLRAEGHDTDSVMVDLVGPAALLLGREWEEDRRSFVDVTLGLVLMHEIIHTMGYEYRDGPKQAGRVRRVMLASAPGSQHVLGLSIVSEFFRKAGWQVVLEVSPSAAELCHAVKNEWFDLVGLSVSVDAQLPTLGALVGKLKAASRNAAMPVLLGGPVFTLAPQQAERFGAQAICVDAREAVDTALALVAR
ncbi:cobalamin B12-binding domain-containing protein [Piscinibacter aquaticus]|uniref:Cobalamin B12-binding domain-containing protein n=1 Tax=Piscinibacter aquaticus TaxID=392597 RepID=A0A5C6U167_9BURK|nr:cobalamin B12-binding domain-containing protein [Piscinibacter aquaticus]